MNKVNPFTLLDDAALREQDRLYGLLFGRMAKPVSTRSHKWGAALRNALAVSDELLRRTMEAASS